MTAHRKRAPVSPAVDPQHPSYGRPPDFATTANARYRDLYPLPAGAPPDPPLPGHDAAPPPTEAHAGGDSAAQTAAAAGARDSAEDWLQEVTPDGRPCWRNVRSLELSWSEPVSWSTQGRPEKPAWIKKPRDDGLVEFVHVVTGESLQPRRTHTAVSEKRRKDLLLMNDKSRMASRAVDEAETALGKKIFDLSDEDLQHRSGHLGSTRSLMDREKYYREFRLVRRADGAADVVKLLAGGEQQVVASLTEEQAAIYRGNPHIHQVFTNGRPFVKVDRRLGAADRIAPRSLEPRMAYARRQGEVKTVEHWGQRKLLMSEIEFLTLYGDRARKVVYAGAAPGDHINFLSSELFPELEWLLVDPAPFACKPTDKIKLQQDYFTDELAASLKDESTLFICDVRSMDSGLQEEDKEGRVFVDMQWQQQWVKIMRPKAAMVKFRLPYPRKETGEADSTEYLDGDIFLPVWGGRTTTETRLVVTDPDSTREYNHKHYEDYMFHFNTVTRTTYYEQPVATSGLDHCFDCASEVFILEQYLKKCRSMKDDDPTLAAEVSRLVDVISRQCSDKGRTLHMHNIELHYVGFGPSGSEAERRNAHRSRFEPSTAPQFVPASTTTSNDDDSSEPLAKHAKHDD